MHGEAGVVAEDAIQVADHPVHRNELLVVEEP
jgi:hypothetical protein